MHDWVNDVIWHYMRAMPRCKYRYLCNLATLQPVSLGEGSTGGTVLTWGAVATP